MLWGKGVNLKKFWKALRQRNKNVADDICRQFEGLNSAECENLWAKATDGMAENDRLKLALELAQRFPANNFFLQEALDIGQEADRMLHVARSILQLARHETDISMYPITRACHLIENHADVDEPERKQALSLFKELIQSKPRKHFFQAQLERQRSNFVLALQELDEHLSENPNDEIAVILRGEIALQSGQPGKYLHAISALRKLKDNPRAKHVIEAFYSFASAQGIDPISEKDVSQNSEKLETPGGACEAIVRLAPSPSSDFQKGKVVFLTHALAAGGAERILANIVRHFRESKEANRTELWLFRKSHGLNSDARFYLPLTGMTEDELHIVKPADSVISPFSWLPTFFSKRAQTMYDDLCRDRPEVFFACLDHANIPGAIAALWAGVPRIILHCHSMRPSALFGSQRTFGWDRVYRSLLTHPSVRLVQVSNAALDDFLQWTGTGDSKQTMVIHNGINFDLVDQGIRKCDPSRVRAEMSIPEGAPLVGTAMRFEEVKQPLLWIESAREIRKAVPDAHFVMFGDGKLLEQSKKYARKLELDQVIHFAGRVEGIETRLPALDIMMLSSQSESFPNTILEAQAAGVVPVVFDVGGVSETMLPQKTGLLVKQKTAAALAKAVSGLLMNRPRHSEMREIGKKFVRGEFSNELMLKKLEKIMFE